MDLPRWDGKGSRCGVGCWRGLACGIIQGADGGEECTVDSRYYVSGTARLMEGGASR
jgi:hypothetical protein